MRPSSTLIATRSGVNSLRPPAWPTASTSCGWSSSIARSSASSASAEHAGHCARMHHAQRSWRQPSSARTASQDGLTASRSKGSKPVSRTFTSPRPQCLRPRAARGCAARRPAHAAPSPCRHTVCALTATTLPSMARHPVVAHQRQRLRQRLLFVVDQGAGLAARHQAAVGHVAAVGEDLFDRLQAGALGGADHAAAGQPEITQPRVEAAHRLARSPRPAPAPSPPGCRARRAA